jgi:hypothetical protein
MRCMCEAHAQSLFRLCDPNCGLSPKRAPSHQRTPTQCASMRGDRRGWLSLAPVLEALQQTFGSAIRSSILRLDNNVAGLFKKTCRRLGENSQARGVMSRQSCIRPQWHEMRRTSGSSISLFGCPPLHFQTSARQGARFLHHDVENTAYGDRMRYFHSQMHLSCCKNRKGGR